MEMQKSACAMYDCVGCEHSAATECPGCLEGNHRLKDASEPVCGVFECVQSHGIESCEGCSESACLLRRSVESICPLRSRFENVRWWAGRMARALESRKPSGGKDKDDGVSARVVNRLRWYLVALDSFAEEGASSVSSWQLAEKVGVNAALIRKDLSRFGEFGTPSFGYRIDFLTQRIGSILGLDKPKGIIWIGAACFRLHFPSVSRLKKHACGVAAVFDIDPEEVGTRVGDYEILPIDQLGRTVSGMNVHTAAVAVPGAQAQVIAEKLSELGIKAILNVSGELLVLPDAVKVASFDLVGELLELCYYCGSSPVDNKPVSG